MSIESEAEKTARFTRHVIQGIIVIAVIIVVIVGSVIVIGLYEVHSKINSLNQGMPSTTIKVSSQDVTVNVPFTVTITTNQIQNYHNIYYFVSGYGSFYTGTNPPYSGTMTTKTLAFQMTITEDDYQNLAENDGYYNGQSMPNSLNTDLSVILTSGTLVVGSADTNIIINN